MKKIFISLGSIVALGLPSLVLAADGVDTSYIDSAFTGATNLLNRAVIFLFSLAVVWFIWNVIGYAMSKEEDGKDKAKTQMIHGIIAIAVMVSIWGIVALLRGVFGVDSNNGAPTSSINSLIPGTSPTAEQSPYFMGPVQR